MIDDYFWAGIIFRWYNSVHAIVAGVVGLHRLMRLVMVMLQSVGVRYPVL